MALPFSPPLTRGIRGSKVYSFSGQFLWTQSHAQGVNIGGLEARMNRLKFGSEKLPKRPDVVGQPSRHAQRSLLPFLLKPAGTYSPWLQDSHPQTHVWTRAIDQLVVRFQHCLAGAASSASGWKFLRVTQPNPLPSIFALRQAFTARLSPLTALARNKVPHFILFIQKLS